MTGAGLRRYVPDPQSGGGFLTDNVNKAFTGAKNIIRDEYMRGKSTLRRVAKRKAKDVLTRTAKRAINDLFGP